MSERSDRINRALAEAGYVRTPRYVVTERTAALMQKLAEQELPDVKRIRAEANQRPDGSAGSASRT